MVLTFILLTFVFTFVGGLVGLKYKDRRHLILGFTAGVLLSVVAFDVLPEIIELLKTTGMDPVYPMGALVIAFLTFHILEKVLLIHHSHEDSYTEHKHPSVGMMSALALAGHSFLDGMGIGLGFQISSGVGVAVAMAVLAHDFSDGLNTVSLMIAHKNSQKRSLVFLFIDALAPLLGGLSTLFFTLPDTALLIYLGSFAGLLLYIGASDILPEAHSQSSSLKTIFMTLLGVFSVFVFSRLAGL